jgi:hypothetical protein
VDDRLVAFPPGDEVFDPFDLLARHHPLRFPGRIENELVQRCDEGGPEGHRRAVRLTEEAGRHVDRIHDRGHILELTLDRIVRSIAAFAAATAVAQEAVLCTRSPSTTTSSSIRRCRPTAPISPSRTQAPSLPWHLIPASRMINNHVTEHFNETPTGAAFF